MNRAESKFFLRLLPAVLILLAFIGLWMIAPGRAWVRHITSPSGTSLSTQVSTLETEPKNLRKNRPPSVKKKEVSYEEMPYPTVEFFLNGKISGEAARILELSEAERALTEETIAKHFKGLEELMRPTIVTTEKKGRANFFIPALPDRGKSEIEAFVNDLSAILQYDRAMKVLEILPITKYFGAFGQFDTNVEVTPKESLPPRVHAKEDWLLIEYTRPENGEKTAVISTSRNLGWGYLPGLFEE